VTLTAERFSLFEPDIGPVSLGLVVFAREERLKLGHVELFVVTSTVSDDRVVAPEEVDLGLRVSSSFDLSHNLVVCDFTVQISVGFAVHQGDIGLAFRGAEIGPVLILDAEPFRDTLGPGAISHGQRLPDKPEGHDTIGELAFLLMVEEREHHLVTVEAFVLVEAFGKLPVGHHPDALFLLSVLKESKGPVRLGLSTEALGEEVQELVFVDPAVGHAVSGELLHVHNVEDLLLVLINHGLFFLRNILGVLDCGDGLSKVNVPRAVSVNPVEQHDKTFNIFRFAKICPRLMQNVVFSFSSRLFDVLADFGGGGSGD